MVFTFFIDAPRERVFNAYSDPKLIPEWWGARIYSTVVERLEFKLGGVWRYLLYDKDGNEFGFNGVFREIVPPEKLVMSFEYEGMRGQILIDHLTFEERDGGTFVTDKIVTENREHRNDMLNSGMENEMRDSVERLTALLKKP